MNEEVTKLLRENDCNIVGFADLRCVSKEVRQNFDRGILIALSYTKEAMQENKNGLPQRYHKEWGLMNIRLRELTVMTADFLVERGYKALAKTQPTVVADEDMRTVLPHKTAATLAGVGWIGKCAMLVTDEVGSALRISVVLTDAPLDCGTPITKSKCDPNCGVCVSVCPGKAPRGGLWEVGVDRDVLFNAHDCRTAARERAKVLLDIEETLCGLCMSNCPFTKRALGYE